ncbi:RING finger protein 207 isoform X7 [Ovis canadensis]|uniref:RING finger protein 207 isoform X7 n=1 Tax=Ovis canadensis TaxID=37174 RepID=UPI0037537743
MSGAIFTPLEGPGALDGTSGHPLVCPLCHAQYERPCLLDCFHEFCAGCLRGRATDGRLACPLCQTRRPRTSATRVGSRCARAAETRRTGHACSRATTSWPWASAAATCSRSAVSAACGDGAGARRGWGRALAGALTAAPAAALHSEPYVLFSTDKKSLLCIRCFRDMQGESRVHCVDLESAYVQGCERLQQAVLEVKALQTATREAIELLQAMVEEVRRSAAEEEAAIQALFSSMQDKLSERKALLLQAVQSLANKAEFLDLGYELMERLQGIVTRPHRLRPAQSSKIASDHRAEFARCLEPLLLLGPRRAAGAGGGTSTLAGGSGPKVLRGRGCPSPVGKMLGSPVQKPTLHRSISTKVLLAEGNDSPFTEHCRHYEDSYRRLQAEMQNLKDQVQELHRDLTKHHSLIKAEIMGDILHKALQVDAQIASEYASVEGLRAVFQEIWEDSYQRVANEQEIYEAQLHDLLQLKQENAYLTTITKQITPYIRSIAKVKERLEPRFQVPVDEPSDDPQNMHDDGVNAEAPARSDPVSVAEKKEKNSELRNSRALGGLAEEPPLKNKDAPRPRSKNGGDAPTWREHPA